LFINFFSKITYENKGKLSEIQRKYRKIKEKEGKERAGLGTYFRGTLLYDKDFQRIKANKGSEIDGKELRKSLKFRVEPLE
jgi:hypothetical protein